MCCGHPSLSYPGPQHQAGILLYGHGGHGRLQGSHGWSPGHTDMALDTKIQRLPVATMEIMCWDPLYMAMDCFWQCNRNQGVCVGKASVTSMSPRPPSGT